MCWCGDKQSGQCSSCLVLAGVLAAAAWCWAGLGPRWNHNRGAELSRASAVGLITTFSGEQQPLSSTFLRSSALDISHKDFVQCITPPRFRA